MAGSFIAISHHGVADAFELLAKLYQKTGDLSEPLADIGEGTAAVAPGALGCPRDPGRGTLGPALGEVPCPQAPTCR